VVFRYTKTMKINLSDYTQLGKNNKPLDGVHDWDGRQVYEIRWSYNQRLLYVLDEDWDKEVIGEFKKENHSNTTWYLSKLWLKIK